MILYSMFTFIEYPTINNHLLYCTVYYSYYTLQYTVQSIITFLVESLITKYVIKSVSRVIPLIKHNYGKYFNITLVRQVLNIYFAQTYSNIKLFLSLYVYFYPFILL